MEVSITRVKEKDAIWIKGYFTNNMKLIINKSSIIFWIIPNLDLVYLSVNMPT